MALITVAGVILEFLEVFNLKIQGYYKNGFNTDKETKRYHESIQTVSSELVT